MRPFALKCLAVCLLASVTDIVASIHIRTLVTNQVALAVGSVILCRFLGFLEKLWFAESPEASKRFWLNAASALGDGIGCALILIVADCMD